MKHDLKELEALDISYYPDEETTFGDYTIKVEQDDCDGEGPREWDNLGTMVCWSRYNLGDVDGNSEFNSQDHFWHSISGMYEEEETDYLTEEQLDRMRDAAFKKNIILPLYLYDHSGITIRTTGFSCPWDSGQVGWIYISLEDVRKEYSCHRVSAKLRKRVEGYLNGEVETYDHFITNNVYWFEVEREDEDGDVVHIDSCGGFYGDYNDDEGNMVSVIKDTIKYDIEHTPQQLDLLAA